MVKDAWLPIGYQLQENILTGPVQFDGDEYQIIKTTGSSAKALIVNKKLANYWLELGLLGLDELQWGNFGDFYYAFITSDEKRILGPLSACERPDTSSEALAFASSLRRTREKGVTVSLTESIYLEKLSLLLPVWEIEESSSDDVLLGRFMTGGVPVSMFSERRLRSIAPWIDHDEIVGICKEAGLQTLIQQSRINENDVGSTTVNKKSKFELAGRPNLEAFFQEHIIDIIENQEQYRALGIDFPSAVVLHGPPGCGKTFAVEKLVEYIDWPCFTVDSNSIGSPYIHETGRKISEVFTNAMQNSPSMVVIDEMESFLADREIGSGSSAHRVEEVAEFLRKIPEAIKKHVIIIGMTNRIEMIDPAILRRGRFDHIIEVPMASEEEVHSLLIKLLSERPCAEDLDAKLIAKKLSGRPLSDVTFVVREASRLTAKAGKKMIDNESIQCALESTTSRGASEKKRKIGFILDELTK